MSIWANGLSTFSTVPRALSRPIDSLARFPYQFLFICDKTCLAKIGFFCFSYGTTYLAISFFNPAIIKNNSNVYALMSPMFFQKLKSFGENVRCRRQTKTQWFERKLILDWPPTEVGQLHEHDST